MAVIQQDRTTLGEEEEDHPPPHHQVLQNNQDTFVDNLVEVKEQYEFKTDRNLVNVKGKLRENIRFYEAIGAPSFILNVIRNGYKIPFIRIPNSVKLANNNSARIHKCFVEEAVIELLNSDRVLEVESPPFVVNPLSVSVQPNGKKRLILDLRYVNKCIRKDRIKYEDWKVVLSYFEKDGYMFCFDLKSGYHHIEIAPECQTFYFYFITSQNLAVYKRRIK